MPRTIADRAVAEWAELNASVGRMDVLDPLFKELENRDVGGSPAEKLRGAKQGLWLMQNKPEDAFRCGPFALDRILAFQNSNYKLEAPIVQSRSTVHGMSLTEVWKLSEKLQMNMQMAVRSTDVRFLLPSVVHWRAGHYARPRLVYIRGHTVTGISSLPLRPWNPEPALEFPTPRAARRRHRTGMRREDTRRQEITHFLDRVTSDFNRGHRIIRAVPSEKGVPARDQSRRTGQQSPRTATLQPLSC